MFPLIVKRVKKMDQEFEEFFFKIQQSSTNEEITKLLKPLRIILWKQQLKSFVIKAFIFITICFSIYYIDILNWYFCAFGRILMIKILPIWDWTTLENSKCLISKEIVESFPLTSSSFNDKDCRTCQHFGES